MQNTGMQSTSMQQIFDQIFLVNVEYGQFGAYRRTTDDDLKRMKTSLPGGGVITKGAKKIFPSEPLQPFGNHKREISRKLASIGVAALGGSARAVPLSMLPEIETYLTDAEDRHRDLKAVLEPVYDTHLAQHIAAIPDSVVRAIVSESSVKKDIALSKLRFKWDIFKVVPRDGDGQGLIDNLTSKLYVEVAQTAKEAYEKSFIGRPRVGQKALHQVKAARNKLAGLSMLDGDNINILVKHIDEVLNELPSRGWIEGKELASLTGLVLTMSDADHLMQHIEKLSMKAEAKSEVVVEVFASKADLLTEVAPEVIQEAPDQPAVTAKTAKVTPVSEPDLFAEASVSTETAFTVEIPPGSILVEDNKKKTPAQKVTGPVSLPPKPMQKPSEITAAIFF